MQPLADFSPDALYQACVENFAERTMLHGRLPQHEVHRSRDRAWCLSPALGGHNSIHLFRRSDQGLAALLAKYRRLQVGTTVWVPHCRRNSELGRRLRALGIVGFGHGAAMAADIHKMREAFPQPRGLRVSVVEDFSIFERFEHPRLGRLTTPLRHAHHQQDIALAKLRPQRVWHFVAMLDAEPLGFSTLLLGAGVAGIYNVGVVKKARRQGIGTAITLAAARFARDLGYRVAVLQAIGAPVLLYQRLGFQDFGKLSNWYYSRTTQEKQSQKRKQWNNTFC